MSRYEDDSEDIIKGLTDRLEELCNRYFSGWKQHGKIGYLAPKNDKDRGSFQVYLVGDGRRDRGEWNRHSQKIGGGPLQLLAYALTGNHKAYRDAYDEARTFLGMERHRAADGDQERRERELAANQAKREDERKARDAAEQAEREETAEYWADFWIRHVKKPIDGTIAETYLRDVRQIPRPPMGWPASLGFCASMPYGRPEDGKRRVRHPALACRIEDVFGETIAVHAVFLDRDGRKAQLPDGMNTKISMGPMLGGAVRLGPAGDRLLITEGVETGLGVAWINHFAHPVWATLGTSGMMGVELPISVKRVDIWADGDRPLRRVSGEYVVDVPPGRRAAHALRDRIVPTGVKGVVVEAPAGTDWLDVFVRNRGEYVVAA